MAKIDDMIPSKSSYLKKEDVGESGRDLVIGKFSQEEVGMDNDVETKLVVHWADPSFKPMVINQENGSRLKMALKTDDTDLMIGKMVNVYADPFVKFGKKLVGGLRIRPVEHAATRNSPPGKPTARKPAAPTMNDGTTYLPESEDNGPESPPLEAYDDDIPF